MDTFFKIISRILQIIFYAIIIDLIFGSVRRRRGGTNRNRDNTQSRYSDEDFAGAGYDRSDSASDFYRGPSQLEQAYQVLGLSQGATLKEVKSRYIELAKKYHPDKNPNNLEAQAEMTKINNAYETIVDDFNRRKN
ncbi:J domain-containing protein [Spiroplasma sp. BIUS-1]|uniref:J domain-containing protein n=1 Tax=Spiroplasma sp. BIUS-1 TaxID=216964 RepID=UPI0013989629|nr:J domain-containing protein [Spiroplasma sp. BIUS-1]QHX36944.1 DnaJ family protein [Spiroplasma sp. BIUS-1]